jgi:hypothetical protein
MDDRLAVPVNYFGAVATLEGLRPLLARGTDPSAVAISSNSTTTHPGLPAEIVNHASHHPETQPAAGAHRGTGIVIDEYASDIVGNSRALILNFQVKLRAGDIGSKADLATFRSHGTRVQEQVQHRLPHGAALDRQFVFVAPLNCPDETLAAAAQLLLKSNPSST